MFPTVVIIGDKNTGKSSLVRCITEDCKFIEEYTETKDIIVTSIEIRIESKTDNEDDFEDIINFVEIPENKLDKYKNNIRDAVCVIVLVDKSINKSKYDTFKYTKYLENKKYIIVSSKSDICGMYIYHDDNWFSSKTCDGFLNITEFIRKCIVN